jgi:hypothetical protein
MMMQIVALLMAITIAAIIIAPSQGAVPCFRYYTRGEAGTSGSNVYTDIANSTGMEDYNNPLYFTLAAAQTGWALQLATPPKAVSTESYQRRTMLVSSILISSICQPNQDHLYQVYR